MNDLQRRVAATHATQARFEGRAFDWRKHATCLHMVRFHAAQMGHQLPTVPRFRSAIGAKKALLAEGVETLTELMDRHFPRIPAAQMRVGDVIAVPGDEGGFECLFIYGQLWAVLGWQEESPLCQTARLTEEGFHRHLGAWRL